MLLYVCVCVTKGGGGGGSHLPRSAQWGHVDQVKFKVGINGLTRD